MMINIISFDYRASRSVRTFSVESSRSRHRVARESATSFLHARNHHVVPVHNRRATFRFTSGPRLVHYDILWYSNLLRVRHCLISHNQRTARNGRATLPCTTSLYLRSVASRQTRIVRTLANNERSSPGRLY